MSIAILILMLPTHLQSFFEASSVRCTYDAVVSHYQKILDTDLSARNPVPRQLLLQVDGEVRTGESCIIWILSSWLQDGRCS